MNIQRNECHHQKRHQIDALGKFLVKAQKDGQNGNEKRPATHSKSTKNAREKPSQNPQKICHNSSFKAAV